MSQVKFKGYKFYGTNGSVILTIPSVIVDSLSIAEGDEAVIWVDDHDCIVIEPKKKQEQARARGKSVPGKE